MRKESTNIAKSVAWNEARNRLLALISIVGNIFLPTIPHFFPMASIQKTATGYRAQVYVRGTRDSQVFRTKREANAWAAQREDELRSDAQKTVGEKRTLADAMAKYQKEVAPQKRGHNMERKRINAFLRDNELPTDTLMCDVSPELFAQYRDIRLKRVGAGTVLREMVLLSAVMEVAKREWRWIETNPLKEIRKPSKPRHRDVVVHPWQLKRLLKAMRYSPRRPISMPRQAAAVCTLVALRTGMRMGELCGLTWDRVHDDFCVLPVTKTKPRNVPLTQKATRLLGKMRHYDETMVFGLSAMALDTLFRKYRARAGLSGFTFHDCRHTAATMMARQVDVLTLCKIFGWSNTSQALTYYNPTASDIARMLDR